MGVGGPAQSYSHHCPPPIAPSIVHPSLRCCSLGPPDEGLLPHCPPSQIKTQLRHWFPVHMHQGLYLYVLDQPRVYYTLVRGPLSRGAQLGAIGPIGLRQAIMQFRNHVYNNNNNNNNRFCICIYRFFKNI